MSEIHIYRNFLGGPISSLLRLLLKSRMKKDEKVDGGISNTGHRNICCERSTNASVLEGDLNHKQYEEHHEEYYKDPNRTTRTNCSSQQQIPHQAEEECELARRQSIKYCLFEKHDHCVEFLEQKKKKQQVSLTSSETRDHADCVLNKEQIEYTGVSFDKEGEWKQQEAGEETAGEQGEESPTYEEWIQQELHPENVRRRKKSTT